VRGILHPFSLVTAAAAVGLVAAHSAAATPPRPAILSVHTTAANGFPLPAVGAPVDVDVRVRNAKTCTFLAQRTTMSALYPVATVPCASGHAHTRVAPIPNRRAVVAKLRFVVRAQDGAGRSAHRTLTIREAAAPPVPTARLRVGPSELTSGGGSVALTFAGTNATTCTIGSTPTLWPGANPKTVSCKGTLQISVPAGTATSRWTLVFTANGSGQAATASRVLTEHGDIPPAAPVGQTSPNWAGYSIKSDSIVTEVGADWIVPKVNCARTPYAGAATWIGIGGDERADGSSTGSLLQTGVTTDCSSGTQQTSAWWEMYPSVPNNPWSFKNMDVSPGDHISATVFRSSDGAHWETHLDDLTTGVSGVMVSGDGWYVTSGGTRSFQGGTRDLVYGGGTSAEWIEEDYRGGTGNLVALSDFDAVTFTNLSTSIPGWTLSAEESITLVDADKTPLATPSSPADGGFSVLYTG
jgi:Peptidase A4 family